MTNSTTLEEPTQLSHSVSDRRTVGIDSEPTREPLDNDVAVAIAIECGVSPRRVHEWATAGELSEDKGLAHHRLTDCALAQGLTVAELGQRIEALLGSTSRPTAEFHEAVVTQNQLDELTVKAESQRAAAIAVYRQHSFLVRGVEILQNELREFEQRLATVKEWSRSIGTPGFRHLLAARSFPFHIIRVTESVSQCTACERLVKEAPAVRKSIESDLKSATEALAQFERKHGITANQLNPSEDTNDE